MNEIIFLIIFIVFIAFALALDLGVFNKNSHVISFKESLMFSSLWVVLALLFFVFLKNVPRGTFVSKPYPGASNTAFGKRPASGLQVF